ncbi:MAG: hypothetical protein ACTSX6_09965 [Candidatus Heimdallarchaeaceae archaeon]
MKTSRIEIKIESDVKKQLKEMLDKLGFDTVSEAIRAQIYALLNNDIDKTVSLTSFSQNFDDSRILEAIERNRELLQQIIELLQKRKEQVELESWLKELLDEVSIDEMKECKTVEELRTLFRYDVQKMYVYDLISLLEKMNVLYYDHRKERLYWRE